MTDFSGQPDPYNLFTLQARSDHAMLATVRGEDPVHGTIFPGWGTRHWFFTRYADCDFILRDSRFGRDLHNRLPADILEHWPKPPESEQLIERHLLGVDPPDHTRMRALVHKAFTPRVVKQLQDRVQEVADQLLDDAAEAGEIDLIEQYAFPIPITLISEMLGIPVEDRHLFRDWVRRLFMPGAESARMIAGMEFMQYMNARIEERRVAPREDVLSGMVQAREDEDMLTHQELLSMIFLLLTAGYETTVHLIGTGTFLLLTHPDQLDLFRREMDDNPDLVKSAIEEIVRYEGPASGTFMRWAWEDVEVGGQMIAQGDAVHPILSAANRDPAVFDNPDRFDITRSPNKHIGFGAGVHYCLGAPLARMEGSVALPSLLRRFPDLRLAVDPADLAWDQGSLHGLMSLPVRL